MFPMKTRLKIASNYLTWVYAQNPGWKGSAKRLVVSVAGIDVLMMTVPARTASKNGAATTEPLKTQD